MIHPKSVMSNMFFLRLVLRRYLQESEWFLPTRFRILGSHPFINNFPMPIDERFPILDSWRGTIFAHAMPISECCFRRKLHGHRESRGVGRLPDACLGGWLGPEICGAVGRIGGGIIGVAEFPWRSWHQRVGKSMSIDENRWERHAFYLVFVANLRGKWWLTSLDKYVHGNWTGFLRSLTFNVAFNILVNILMGHMPTKPNFRMLPATFCRRHNWQPSGSVLQTLAVCCQLGILWLVYGILLWIIMLHYGTYIMETDGILRYHIWYIQFHMRLTFNQNDTPDLFFLPLQEI